MYLLFKFRGKWRTWNIISNSNSCICPKIKRVSSLKYLDLIVDWTLRWNIHIGYDVVMHLTSFFSNWVSYSKFCPEKQCAIFARRVRTDLYIWFNNMEWLRGTRTESSWTIIKSCYMKICIDKNYSEYIIVFNYTELNILPVQMLRKPLFMLN